MKTCPSILRAIALSGVLYGFCALTGDAQTATSSVTPTSTATTPGKAIGPAPANSKQKEILSDALSPQTRQTLQEAMNSYDPAPAKSAANGK